ncbi:XRE family transcriptional regulator [Lactococcus lactis]|uniref:XRE family transcriptional regulator n=1 Tax=Lactococcus lactis TaxID=1358 RepID=UPI00288C7CD6|nr:XRE family transcriptional regulator [Lactococcus lactis]MDT2860433.1 XRE family transcriptional regulator [Lactococcus lactis]
MPETVTGREKILKFIEDNGVKQIDLATQYGIRSGDFADIMTGKDASPKANRVILKIISDFKIR